MTLQPPSGKARAPSPRTPDPTEPRPEIELVHAAQRGDKRAFVEIVARHQAMVCGIALAILKDFAASEDAAQEAFLTAWRKFQDLRDPSKLRGWLGQIARNAALTHQRRHRTHDPLEDATELPDAALAPDEIAANEEEAALVREFLAKLPEVYRLPLILYYRDGQSVRAVAEALGLSEDAVKQRLARGREMVRDRMAGWIESVLTRTGPTAAFTIAIAAAIQALASPTAVAGGVFAAAAADSASTSATFLAAMTTSKTTCFALAAVVTALCIPLGYHAGTREPPPMPTKPIPDGHAPVPAPEAAVSAPQFEHSALFAEWRQLHETHGTNPEAMPRLYQAIADIADPFRRRGFRTALMAEWVQLDAAGGLKFFFEKGRDSAQRRQFFDEWLRHDAPAAVNSLITQGPGWESVARDALVEIARRLPSYVPDLVRRLPESESYWDTEVRQAFAVLSEGDLASARAAAEAMTGPNREQALSGVALQWGKTDFAAALDWAQSFPPGTDRDEMVRVTLMGRAAIDPVGALEQVGLVPPGGRSSHFATTTGARVLAEAAKADFETTAAWLGSHPGRLAYEDLMGMARAVTDRLNADPVAFLDQRMAEGSLAVLTPAIGSAILNNAAGQRGAIWEWLKAQPDNAAVSELRKQVINSAGYQDPSLALAMVSDLPSTPEGDSLVQSLANSLLNGGSAFHRFEQLLKDSSDRLRQPLLSAGFSQLNADTMDDPQVWIGRLALLPEANRNQAVESIARAWGSQAPENAIVWAGNLPVGVTRAGALANITATWAMADAQAAAGWVASMNPGVERDHIARALVVATAERYPREAWDWALSIQDPIERNQAIVHAARTLASRDPDVVRPWVASGRFAPDLSAQLKKLLERNQPAQPSP